MHGLQGSVEFAGQGHPAREWPVRFPADGQQTADGLGRRVQLKQDPDPDVGHGTMLAAGWLAQYQGTPRCLTKCAPVSSGP